MFRDHIETYCSQAWVRKNDYPILGSYYTHVNYTFFFSLLGFDKLLTYVTQEWLQDIKKHQLPSLLGGVGPMYSFVRLIQGIRDLIQLPIEQYQKDGRIVRGLQRGANSFTTSTAMAALEIATRIVNLIQVSKDTFNKARNSYNFILFCRE